MTALVFAMKVEYNRSEVDKAGDRGEGGGGKIATALDDCGCF